MYGMRNGYKAVILQSSIEAMLAVRIYPVTSTPFIRRTDSKGLDKEAQTFYA